MHGNEELNAILNADGQTDDDNTLPRLSLAIEYKEKKVLYETSYNICSSKVKWKNENCSIILFVM